MEQIDGHRVSLSRRVARGLAHELISYGQNHKMMSHFGISATGTSKDKGSALFHCISKPRNAKCEKRPGAISTFRLPGLQRTKGSLSPLHFETPKREMRKAPRSHFDISATGTSKDKGVSLFHCISKPRNAKCEKRPGAISAFRLPGLQRTKGSLHCIEIPETRNPSKTKCEKRPGAISAFRLPGLQRTKGYCIQTQTEMRKAPRSHFGISATGTSKDISLPLHFETPKREMRKAPRSHFDISATGTSKDKGVSLTPLHFPETPKREMRKAPRSHFGISATGTSKDKGVSPPLHFETPKREMRKAPRSHFGISATGTSKDTGSLFMFSVSATLHGKSS
jgi:hypothetical protein